MQPHYTISAQACLPLPLVYGSWKYIFLLFNLPDPPLIFLTNISAEHYCLTFYIKEGG